MFGLDWAFPQQVQHLRGCGEHFNHSVTWISCVSSTSRPFPLVPNGINSCLQGTGLNLQIPKLILIKDLESKSQNFMQNSLFRQQHFCKRGKSWVGPFNTSCAGCTYNLAARQHTDKEYGSLSKTLSLWDVNVTKIIYEVSGFNLFIYNSRSH